MEVIYWNEKIERFIKDLDPVTIARVINSTGLLREHGHLLDMPDSKCLGKGLFELRINGKVKVRLLYVFHRNRAFIIHGFVKKTWKIQGRDMDYARHIQKEIMGLE